MKNPSRLLLLVVGFLLTVVFASARTVRVLVVGNSFSKNATHYLPDLAKEGGHELILAFAQAGGCPLERHWNALAADLAKPGTPDAKIYWGGTSLLDAMGKETFDIITIQQYSLLSGDPATYHPYAEKLVAELKRLQPKAEIVVHQTWAYRVDAPKFGQYAEGKFAANAQEMWVKSRAAYHALAKQFSFRVIPTGDAFWTVNSDPVWAFQRDAAFDYDHAKAPSLPNQKNSLHVGYTWPAGKKLAQDANHANAAGEYLGGLVWYAFLFNESPEKLTFVPPKVPADFAAHLRKVAAQTVLTPAQVK